jgi:uncharacterized protein involved in exopolysaccharide biosynthesis
MVIQVTPRGLLNIMFRHRNKFALAFLPIFGLATIYCFVLATPRYESDASLLVKFADSQSNQSNGLPSPEIAAAQLERVQIVNSQIGLLLSEDLLTDVLHAAKIDTVYPALIDDPDPAQRMDPKLKLDTALTWLNRDLDIEPAKNANIINLALLNPDAEVAARVLNQLIDKFDNRQWAIYQNAQLPFMQNQLAQARVKLEQSRAAVEQFKAQNGINSLDEERTLLLKQQSDAQENLTQAISKQEEAQGRYQQLEEMLKSIPREIALSDENDRFKAVDDARQRLDDLRSRQKQMSDNYRSDSIPMKTLNAQVDFAQQQLAQSSRESAARIRSGVNPVRQQTEVELTTAAGDQYGATASRASFEAALAAIQEKLGKLEAQSQQLDALTLQQQVDEENFRNYLQAVNDASVNDDLNRQRITSIAVIQAPSVPALPTRPRTKIVVPAAFLLGLAAAITIVLLAEMFDETFSTPDQIEAVLGLTVLGSFNRRRRLPALALPAYAKLLPLVAILLLSAAAVPRAAFGFDQLDPAYGQSLVIRDQSGQISEELYPRRDRFIRESPTGGTLGWAQRMGSSLAFFDRDGRQISTARRELLPPNYPIGAIAIVRDASGNAIGMVTR